MKVVGGTGVEERDGKYGNRDSDFCYAGSKPDPEPRAEVVHHCSYGGGCCQRPTEVKQTEHVLLQIVHYAECAFGPAQFDESWPAHAVLAKSVLLYRFA